MIIILTSNELKLIFVGLMRVSALLAVFRITQPKKLFKLS